jgi:quinol monooxygenase YgiN
MATGRIGLLVDLEVHDGKFGEFEAIAKEMLSVSEQETGTLNYKFHLSADRKQSRLVEGYSDQAAVTAHFKGRAVQWLVPQLIQVCSPKRMEFYGDPGSEVAAMATAFGAELFIPWEGFER